MLMTKPFLRPRRRDGKNGMPLIVVPLPPLLRTLLEKLVLSKKRLTMQRKLEPVGKERRRKTM
jgi:hypothetical protein